MYINLKESLVKARKLPKSADVLVARCEFLAPQDRALIEAVMLGNQSSLDISRLTGINARTVRYRIHKLAKRMASKRFIQAARLLMYLPSRDAELVRRHYLRGESLRQVAAAIGTSLHVLRRDIDRLEGEMAYHSRQQALRRVHPDLVPAPEPDGDEEEADLSSFR